MDLSRFRVILRTLAKHRVDFIVVGGIAAVLDGVPAQTDLDIVHSRSADNLSRLVAALIELDAHCRFHPKHIAPNESHLASPGRHLLMSNCGMLDVLGTAGKGRTYEDLIGHSPMMELEPDVSIHVLNLEMLITTKEKAARDKDLRMLPELRAALNETRRQKF